MRKWVSARACARDPSISQLRHHWLGLHDATISVCPRPSVTDFEHDHDPHEGWTRFFRYKGLQGLQGKKGLSQDV
eukprot:1153434-Pelagomonas_calceolata.AAC.10